MPLQIVRNDITKMKVDAIVNAANSSLQGGGGVDGAIHKVAGPELLEACKALDGCKVGEAKLTPGFRLPSKYVIHTVGPVWRGGVTGERGKLASCYRNALELARANNCDSVAFPLISAGAYGYPADKAIRVAVDTIGEFLLENDMDVYLVVFGSEAAVLGRRLFSGLREFIDDHYVEAQKQSPRESAWLEETARLEPKASHEELADFDELPSAALFADFSEEASETVLSPEPPAAAVDMPPEQPRPQASSPQRRRAGLPAHRRTDRDTEAKMGAHPAASRAELQTQADLSTLLHRLDESFQQMLLRKIDERGMSDAMCYKKANIDRKLFSKIRSDVHYQPSKRTAVAFAIALELDLEETESMLRKAGYALSPSSVFDVIIEYFILHGEYNIFLINEALFAWDQVPLGG